MTIRRSYFCTKRDFLRNEIQLVETWQNQLMPDTKSNIIAFSSTTARDGLLSSNVFLATKDKYSAAPFFYDIQFSQSSSLIENINPWWRLHGSTFYSSRW